MSIKRYSIESGIYSPPTGPLLRSRLDVEEAEDGPWVKYDDHVAEVERLTADLAVVNERALAWEQGYARVADDLAVVRAERDGLAEALRRSGDLHDENDDHAYRTRRGDGKGHHCQWRVLAEALAERSRAALTEARAALAALRTKGE